MPTFDGGSSVESLDYDFSKVPDYPKRLKNKGTVVEPSDSRIGKFLEDMKALYKEAAKMGLATADADNMSPDELMQALDSVSGDDFVKIMSDMGHMFADLCGGSPDYEQIMALPLRVRQGFYAWINGEVVRPEAGNDGGKAEVVRLPTAATG